MLCAGFVFFVSACICHAKPSALLVIGNTGDESDLQAMEKLAAEARVGLIARGIADAEIRLLSDRVTRESLIQAIGEVGGKASADEEFWLILLGHGGRSSGGEPAFQLRGPRMTAGDLKAALEPLSARKCVVIATDRSGGFLPFLEMPNGSAVAATTDQGQINQPRFPEHWIAALKAVPKATFAELSAAAASAVEADYKNQGLVQGENARMILAGSPEILKPPFGVADASAQTPPPAAGGSVPRSPAFSVRDIQIPKSDNQELFVRVTPTDETRSLLAEVSEIKGVDSHPAWILNQTIDYVVNPDRSTSETREVRVFLAREEALDVWANFHFDQQPPLAATKVLAARVIQPDGTSYVLNPERLTNSQVVGDAPGSRPSPATILHLPQAGTGAIVELATRTDVRAALELPEFYQEFDLQESAPILKSQITLKLPKGRFYHRLMNFDAKPEVSQTQHSEVLQWTFTDVPAFEPLPFDPPKRDTARWLGISSLKSWEDFADWFLRISHQADEVDDAVKAKAAEIAALHPDRESRIRAAFEYVAGLRYVAIEFGINAFRPRTPSTVMHQQYGDCKDKANLLVALLREMQIPANFVLINRGSSTTKDFPGWQFNHAIAYVPGDSDGSAPLWLDSTEPAARFGTISPGNIGRSALVFNDKGATFREVSGGGTTEIRQSWKFRREPNGSLRGTMSWEGTGLADYDLRSEIAPLLPKQREFVLSNKVDAALPGADASAFQISDPRDYGKAMRVDAGLALAAPVPPTSGLSWLSAFAPIRRDRPLVIKDGQPLRFEQTLEWPLEREAPLPSDFESNVAGTRLRIQYQRDGDVLTRTAICDVQKPQVSPEAYPALRAALHDWNRRLAQNPN